MAKEGGAVPRLPLSAARALSRAVRSAMRVRALLLVGGAGAPGDGGGERAVRGRGRGFGQVNVDEITGRLAGLLFKKPPVPEGRVRRTLTGESSAEVECREGG